ncbi:MAG: RNA polymerase sigma factor, partial [Chloroflexota bacterium]|nr:RNA polymerase sigma factor [Chloroflexota bacterium]
SSAGGARAERDGHAPARPDDAALVIAAQADPRAFAPLYDRYVGPIYGYCYTRLGDPALAEDATSEVFVKALAALPRYQQRDQLFAGWLFRIARNVVVDAHRRRRPTEPLSAAEEAPDPAQSPEEVAVGRAECAALRAALARLPDDQRAAVECQLAGWSGQQTADALGRSVDAVKMLRFRAHTRLRTLLRETGGDD